MKAIGLGVLLIAVLGIFALRSNLNETAGFSSPNEVELPLGDSTVTVVIHEHDEPSFAMLVLHDDENTAVEAGLAFAEEYGGRLVELRAQGERRVRFSIGGVHYDLDPNRIFTEVGIRATLSPNAADEAVIATRTFADSLVALYDPDDVIVTLHNNTPENYSALSYAEGGQFESDAEAVHIEEGVDPDDFFYVTDRRLFDALRDADFNVVIQNNASVRDDGSLSVWAARRNLLYVNVEAEHGHCEQQKAMIKALEIVLASLGNRD